MSDLERRIEEEGMRPITVGEALRRLGRIRERAKELDDQRVTIRYEPAPLSLIREKYIRPMLEAIRRMRAGEAD